MRVVDLKTLERERGLRGYSRLRKSELIALLQNSPPALRTTPPRPTGALGPPLRGDHLCNRLGLDQVGLGSLVHKK